MMLPPLVEQEEQHVGRPLLAEDIGGAIWQWKKVRESGVRGSNDLAILGGNNIRDHLRACVCILDASSLYYCIGWVFLFISI